jgi:hypothetical protein
MPQKTDKVIAPYPPSDGREWENQCARCGSTVAWEDCTACQEGYTGRRRRADPLRHLRRVGGLVDVSLLLRVVPGPPAARPGEREARPGRMVRRSFPGELNG